MKYNKNLIAGAIAACIAPAAHAEIELGSGFSLTGFIDMSYFNLDVDGAESTEKSLGVDQFETDFLFEGSEGVSAQVDIEFGGTSTTPETWVEQAFITKAFGDKFSIKAGRFLSYTGWETEEPTGLFQYSFVGYQPYFYGWYQQGVSAYADFGTVELMASVINSAFDPYDYNSDAEIELGIGISPGDNFTAKLFVIEEGEDTYSNLWSSFKAGPMTFAAEYVDRDLDAGGDGDGYMVMANYAKGFFGFTVRYGDYAIDDTFDITTIGPDPLDTNSITLSPSFKIGDKLLIVTEYRMDEYEAGGIDNNTAAVEALFMF
jgi:hypothetical protein